MKAKAQILFIAALLIAGGGASSLWYKDQSSLQVILEQFDIPVALSLQARFNIPDQYEGYFITELKAWHSDEGTEATTDDTEIEVKDITADVVIDTIVIEPGQLEGASRNTVSYEVTGGTEISVRVIEITDTPGDGLRFICRLSDENRVRQ